jgi:hypothetical protein
MTAKKTAKLDLATIKKHHFWILSGTLVLVALVCWVVGGSLLSSDYAAKKSQRESVYSAVSAIPSDNPNEKFTQFVDDRKKVLASDVYQGWDKRFRDQAEIVYTWPLWMKTEYWADIERCRFEDKEIDSTIRQYYLNQLKAEPEFPKLYDLIRVRKPIQREVRSGAGGAFGAPGSDGGGPAGGNFQPPGVDPGAAQGAGGFGPPPGVGGGGPSGLDDDGQLPGAGIEHEGVVAWNQAERNRLEMAFGKSWTTPPTTAQMLYTQESINIYRALLFYVVARTNEDVAEHHLATIKKINTLLIGRDALQAMGRIGGTGQQQGGFGIPGVGGAGTAGQVPPGTSGIGQPPAAAQTDGGGATAGATLGQPPGANDAGGYGGDKGYGDAGADGAFPGDSSYATTAPDGTSRFVDLKGQPVADPKQQPFSEFRMLPVSMRLIMDHRKLPQLLANCANSPVPLEVQQINIRSATGRSGQGSTGFGSTSGLGGIPGVDDSDGGGFTPPGGGLQGAGVGGSGGGFAGRGLDDDAGGQADAFGGGQSPGAFGSGAGTAPSRRISVGEVELGPYDMEVEIQGVVLIFNPPNDKKLGTGTLAQGGAAGTATPAAAGGTAPATTAPPPATGSTATTPPATTQPATAPGGAAEGAATLPAAAQGGSTPAATPPAGTGGTVPPANQATAPGNTPAAGPPAGTPPAGAAPAGTAPAGAASGSP